MMLTLHTNFEVNSSKINAAKSKSPESWTICITPEIRLSFTISDQSFVLALMVTFHTKFEANPSKIKAAKGKSPESWNDLQYTGSKTQLHN